MAPKTRIRPSTLVCEWKSAGHDKEAIRKNLKELGYTLQRISQLLHGFEDTHIRPRGATAPIRKRPAALPIRASILKRPAGRARPGRRALDLRAAGKSDEEIQQLFRDEGYTTKGINNIMRVLSGTGLRPPGKSVRALQMRRSAMGEARPVGRPKSTQNPLPEKAQ